MEPALLTLLGVEPAPPAARDALFAAWRIFFERIAERGTTVLLFEDLQWADSGLLDFIDHLLDWSQRADPRRHPRPARALRPSRGLGRGQPEPRVAWRSSRSRDAAMRELLDGFVPGLPDDASRRSSPRAEGMPLYAVELVRALAADGRLQLVDGGLPTRGELAR